MHLALFLLFLRLSPGTEAQKYQDVDELFYQILNHSRLLSADQEAEKTARHLLEKYPDDPYLYNLWASTEWLLIGRELNLKADEQREIDQTEGYDQRAKRYQANTEKGLALTEGKNDSKNLFLKATLKFDQAKFASRYESHISGLNHADQKAGEGIQILKQILAANPNFCSVYFFLGGTRLQLATKVGGLNWIFVRLFSETYTQLRSLDSDVFNEQKSIEWLEKAYQCGYPQPWLKKTWLETTFLLAKAYRDYGKGLGTREEMAVLQKEVPLLKQLGGMFPQNQDVASMLVERELRLKVLQNYFSKK